MRWRDPDAAPGYAWLTNHVPPRRASQKLLLFSAMAGFFIAARAIQHAFEWTGVLFGIGYLHREA
jgi:low temperature requirement protein LtrA